jgi:hypothetical protein
MNQAKEMKSCEVCGSTALRSVLNLGTHPLCDDLVAIGDGRVCKEYSIEILYCEQCGTAHQRFQVPKQELFPKTYHYRSRFTADVLNGMSALVDTTAQRLGGLDGKVVLDVGCNDSSLLDFFKVKGATTIGLEPTDACSDGLNKGHDLYNDFLSVESAQKIHCKHPKIDVIAFTNVFAHIEDLPSVIAALKVLMTDKTMLVIENHYLGAVLDRHQFDTFYHEHPRTYSLRSFMQIAKNLGAVLSGVEFPSRYGGNIRIFMNGPVLHQDKSAIDAVLQKEAQYGVRFAQLAGNVEKWKSLTRTRIQKLVAQHGPLVAKAFPGRAAILVKLLGIDKESIATIHEKPGSMKIGHYVPGTRIPIKSDDDLFKGGAFPPVIVNLAWHIGTEITGYLRKTGFQGEVFNILDPQEFA